MSKRRRASLAQETCLVSGAQAYGGALAPPCKSFRKNAMAMNSAVECALSDAVHRTRASARQVPGGACAASVVSRSSSLSRGVGTTRIAIGGHEAIDAGAPIDVLRTFQHRHVSIRVTATSWRGSGYLRSATTPRPPSTARRSLVSVESSALLRWLCDAPDLLEIVVETWLETEDADACRALVALSMTGHGLARWLNAHPRLYTLRAQLLLQQRSLYRPHAVRFDHTHGAFGTTRVAHVIELGQLRMLHGALSYGALHCAKPCCELARTMFNDRLASQPTLMEPTRRGGMWMHGPLNGMRVLCEPRVLETLNVCSEMLARVDADTDANAGAEYDACDAHDRTVCMAALTTRSKIHRGGKWKMPRQTVTFHMASYGKPRQLQLHIAGGILAATPTLSAEAEHPSARALGVGVSMAMPSCNGKWALVVLGCETEMTRNTHVGGVYSMHRVLIGRLCTSEGRSCNAIMSPSRHATGGSPTSPASPPPPPCRSVSPDAADEQESSALLKDAIEQRLVPSDTVTMCPNYCFSATEAIQATVYHETEDHRRRQLADLNENGGLFSESMTEVAHVLHNPVARDPLRLMGGCIDAQGTATLFCEPSDSAYLYDRSDAGADVAVQTNVVHYGVVSADGELRQSRTYQGYAIASSVVGRSLHAVSKDGLTAVTLMHREATNIPGDVPRAYSLMGRVCATTPCHATALEDMHNELGFAIKHVYDLTLVDATHGAVAILASVVCVDADATPETHARYEPLALIYAALGRGHAWFASPTFVSLPCESSMRASLRSTLPLFHGTCTASPSGTVVFVHASSLCVQRAQQSLLVDDPNMMGINNFGDMIDQLPIEPCTTQWRVLVRRPSVVTSPLLYMHALGKDGKGGKLKTTARPTLHAERRLTYRWTQEGRDCPPGVQANADPTANMADAPQYAVPRDMSLWMSADASAVRRGEVTILHAAQSSRAHVDDSIPSPSTCKSSILVKAHWTTEGFVMEIPGGACCVSAVPTQDLIAISRRV